MDALSAPDQSHTFHQIALMDREPAKLPGIVAALAIVAGISGILLDRRKTIRFRKLCTKSLISLCNLCVLCVSVVVVIEQFLNHRGTEDTEIAQRRSPIRTFRAKPLEL
jgi:hypothetical protein